MNCPHCGFDSPPNMLYCGSCGTRLRSVCAECGFANPLDYRFCGMCGTRLELGVAQPAIEQSLPLPSSNIDPLFSTTQPQLEGERRVVSVVLTDLTDSTNLLERVGTEGWVELMNNILHILESEINRFGGKVSQFRGDGLVAFFGATSAHEDDPERAVLAALSMQSALDQYTHELARREANELRMRVGVSTGEVIVASASNGHQHEETAMGLAVAIAARMESAAEPGTVLVSEFTYRLVESQFVWRALGAITVKGMSQPIAVYQPQVHIADADILSHGQVFPNFIPRIGRDAEFHILKNCVEELCEGRGGIVALTSEKGGGKSSMLNEARYYFEHKDSLLAETSTGSPPAPALLTWVQGRCRSYNQMWPYSMWQDLFRAWLELRAEDSKEEQRGKLHRRAEELWGRDFEDHYPYLATFLGLPVEETFTDKIRHLDGEGLRQRFFLAVRSWIESASRNGPVTLAFSDMQWADASSLALLKYCLPICDSESLLWLLTFRLERETSIWEFHHYLEVEYPHRLTNVNLSPLTDSQSNELIAHLIGSETLPQETRSLIIHNAEGNPYYIIELIRALIAAGVLTRASSDSAWHVTRMVTTLDLPDSLQRLLLARIDRLSTHERLVLQIAALIGPVFWLNMMQALLGGKTHTLKADLAALQRAQFIRESGRVPELGMQYFFKSPLVRDTVYDNLLNINKTTYHLKAAEYLENLTSADVPGNYDGMLAYHYQGAGNPKKELFYTCLAAEQAQRMYANTEALQHYSRALELLDKIESDLESKGKNRSIQAQRFEILNGRRKALFSLGQIDAARIDTKALLPLARQMADDPAWLIDALLAQAEISFDNREELRLCLQSAQEALMLSRQLNDQHREMQSLIGIASASFHLKEPQGEDMAEQALNLARQLGDLRTEVGILVGISEIYGMDSLTRSREYLEAALARSESLNDKAIELTLLEAISRQFERDGDYYRQLTEYEQKRLRLSREIGDRVAEGYALMFCGQIQSLYLGDYETGMELEKQALRIWENLNNRLFPLLRIAQIQTAQGKYAEALAALETANPLGKMVLFDIGRAGLGLVTVILYNALGDEQRLRSALEITSQIQQMVADNLVSRQYHMTAACEASATYLNLAQSLAENEANATERQARLRKALESSQAALNLYEQFGFVQVVECTSEEIFFRHSQALMANNRAAEAAEFLKRAHAEMMRKYELIPADSPFRKTYLENIKLHRDIRATYAAQNANLVFPISTPDSN